MIVVFPNESRRRDATAGDDDDDRGKVDCCVSACDDDADERSPSPERSCVEAIVPY